VNIRYNYRKITKAVTKKPEENLLFLRLSTAVNEEISGIGKKKLIDSGLRGFQRIIDIKLWTVLGHWTREVLVLVNQLNSKI